MDKSTVRYDFVEEVLKSCLREFEELENTYDWFTTACIGRLHKALKLLKELRKETTNAT